jgi:2-haloacid dehalogenase
VTPTGRVELVVLDVNETLFSLTPIARRMAEVGLDGRLELWFARVLRDGIAAAATGRIVTFRELAEHHLLDLLPAQVTSEPDTAVDHVLAGFGEVAPHPDVEPGLRSLRDAGIEVVTLTNGSADITHAFLERAGLTALVDGVHDVTEVGRWKPAPEPYRGVLERRGVAPEAAAMVAVHPWDLLGAGSVGMITAWLDRGGAGYPAPFGAPDVRASTLEVLAAQLVESPG